MYWSAMAVQSFHRSHHAGACSLVAIENLSVGCDDIADDVDCLALLFVLPRDEKNLPVILVLVVCESISLSTGLLISASKSLSFLLLIDNTAGTEAVDEDEEQDDLARIDLIVSIFAFFSAS